MQNEFDRHKSSDAVKWFLTLIAFIIVGVMLAGIILGWFIQKPKTEDDVNEDEVIITDTDKSDVESEEIYAMPKAMSFTSTSLYNAMETNNAPVSVTIEAQVWPINAPNREVDYSVSWAVAPTYGNNPVTDYVTVTQADDGDLVATVSCYKAFGSDTILLKVTTRDGGFSDTCIISFVGTADSIVITGGDMVTTTTTERGEYYALGTGKTYNFDVVLDNAFHVVGSHNLTTTLDAEGVVYFGTMFSDGSSGFSYFETAEQKELSQVMDKFIKVSLDGTKISVTTDSKYIENYYSHSGPDEYYMGVYYYDQFVYLDKGGLTGGSSGVDYQTIAEENQQLLKTCYFTITVSDSVSGLSTTIKVWIEPSVSSVSLSDTTLEF